MPWAGRSSAHACVKQNAIKPANSMTFDIGLSLGPSGSRSGAPLSDDKSGDDFIRSGERRHKLALRRRRALPITDTELRDMAAAAMAGLKRMPVNGYRTPAAIGTPREL